MCHSLLSSRFLYLFPLQICLMDIKFCPYNEFLGLFFQIRFLYILQNNVLPQHVKDLQTSRTESETPSLYISFKGITSSKSKTLEKSITGSIFNITIYPRNPITLLTFSKHHMFDTYVNVVIGFKYGEGANCRQVRDTLELNGSL